MDVDSCVGPLESAVTRHPQPSCPAMPTAQTDGQCWVRPAGMSDGHPDSPIVHRTSQYLLGTERWMWTVVLGHSSRHSQPSCPAMPTAQTDGQCWVRPAGMSDGHPDSPIVHRTSQSLLGTERWMWTVVLGHSSRHPQPSCPAMPTAQTDGHSLGPAGRHVRRPSRPPDRASECPVSTGN